MVEFAAIDARGYPTVDVRSGYAEWAASYEQTVADALDVDLIETLGKISWPRIRRAVDLGCGTGRTGAWLAAHGIGSIDGVDLTPEMIAVARSRGVYGHLIEADVSATGLGSEDYDLVTTCLVDEHLADLRPLYCEAWRLGQPLASFVLVGIHPHFIMASGMPTHFHDPSGEAIAIETHVHLLSEHVGAGLVAGWTLVEMKERVVDGAWLALKPSWEPLLGQPIAFAFVWRKPGS